MPTAALTALPGLRDSGKVQAGQRIVINGAAGGAGTFAVQIAKALAAEVTGVCSTRNVDLVRPLGADDVIGYTQEDSTRRGARYDLILDNVGNRWCAGCTRAPGRTLLTNTGHAGIGRVIMAFARSVFVRQQRGRPLMVTPKAEDLVTLDGWIEAERVTAVIDRTYRLQEAPEALSCVGEGHARGKVVIAVGPTGADGGSAAA